MRVRFLELVVLQRKGSENMPGSSKSGRAFLKRKKKRNKIYLYLDIVLPSLEDWEETNFYCLGHPDYHIV